MVEQIACVFSTIAFVDGAFVPTFDSQLQAGEKWSGSMHLLPNGKATPVIADFLLSDDTGDGITICYVMADEARIAAADYVPITKPDYLVLWREYAAENAANTSQMSDENMTGAELSNILAYLAENTPYSAPIITQWVINKFEVSTQQEAVAWATSRPRTSTVAKLMTAMRQWSEAKAELDLL